MFAHTQSRRPLSAGRGAVRTAALRVELAADLAPEVEVVDERWLPSFFPPVPAIEGVSFPALECVCEDERCAYCAERSDVLCAEYEDELARRWSREDWDD